MLRLFAIVVAVVAITPIAAAQSPAPGGTPPPTLSRELELEREIAELKIARAKDRVDLEAARAQLHAALATIDALLKNRAAAEAAALEKELKPIEEKLVKAHGGDPAKGDRWSFSAKTVVKAPGE